MGLYVPLLEFNLDVQLGFKLRIPGSPSQAGGAIGKKWAEDLPFAIRKTARIVGHSELLQYMTQSVQTKILLVDDFSDSSKARKKQNFLDDLANSDPAVRLYSEGRATGPPEDTSKFEHSEFIIVSKMQNALARSAVA